MSAESVLTWASRALFAVAIVLFVSLFIVMAAGSENQGVDANGHTVNLATEGEMRRLVLIFASTAWCGLAGGALRTLAEAASWPRALLEIAPLVGFGMFFAAPLAALAGGSGSPDLFAAAVLFICGFLVIIVAGTVKTALFGKGGAAVRVQRASGHGRGSIADARVEPYPPPPPPYPGFVAPAGPTFTPESSPPELPRTGAQS